MNSVLAFVFLVLVLIILAILGDYLAVKTILAVLVVVWSISIVIGWIKS